MTLAAGAWCGAPGSSAGARARVPGAERALAMGQQDATAQRDASSAANDAATLAAAMAAAATAATESAKGTPAPAALAPGASVADASATAVSISASVASALIMQLGMPRRPAPNAEGASATPAAGKKAGAAGTSTFSDVLAQRSSGGDDPANGSGGETDRDAGTDQIAQMYVLPALPCLPAACLPALPLPAGVRLPATCPWRPHPRVKTPRPSTPVGRCSPARSRPPRRALPAGWRT